MLDKLFAIGEECLKNKTLEISNESEIQNLSSKLEIVWRKYHQNHNGVFAAQSCHLILYFLESAIFKNDERRFVKKLYQIKEQLNLVELQIIR